MVLICLIASQAMLSGRQMAAKLTEGIRTDKIEHYSVYVVDPALLYDIAITPARLRRYPQVKIERADFTKEKMQSFRAALRDTTFYKSRSISIDVRYGAAVVDKRGDDMLFICMNGDRTLAAFNGSVYRTNGRLGRWFGRVGRELLKSRM